jgi:hypothetical protein
MRVQYWELPVEVTLEGRDNRRTITATCFACECLLTLWPDCHGPAYRAALTACGDAMRGETDQLTARTAFIRAAREAQVLTHR